MRNLLRLMAAVALAGAALVGCDRLPEEPSTDMTVAKASQPSNSARSDAPHPIFQVRTWGDNSDMWEFLAPQFSSPSADPSHAPLYVISPTDDPDSPHSTAFFGPHDHVVPVPPQNGGTFSAMWHIHLVTDGSGNLVHLGDSDGDGDDERLTSAARIEGAAEKDSGVTVVALDLAFPCPVRSL